MDEQKLIPEEKAKPEFYVLNTLKKAKENASNFLKGYKDKYVMPVKDFGGEFKEGIKHDMCILREQLGLKDKTLFPDTPFKSLREKMKNKFGTLKSNVSVATQDDIEALKQSIEELKTKVESLNQKDPIDL